MNPFQILVNNTPIQLGATLPTTITHFKATCLFPIRIPKGQAPLVKQWLNTIVDRLTCEYVEYNGVLIHIDDIKKFEF